MTEVDLTLIYIALVFLIVQGAATLILTAGLYVIYKKKNGAGEKSPEWWTIEIDRIVARRLDEAVETIEEYIAKILKFLKDKMGQE